LAKTTTSIKIDEDVWKEIRKKAIDAGKPVGDYIAYLFMSRTEG